MLSGIQFSIICNTETGGCTYNSTPFSGGPITLTWTRNSDYSTRSSGRIETERPTERSTWIGQRTWYRAAVSGTILGASLSSLTGSIGTFRNASISIRKTQGGP